MTLMTLIFRHAMVITLSLAWAGMDQGLSSSGGKVEGSRMLVGPLMKKLSHKNKKKN